MSCSRNKGDNIWLTQVGNERVITSWAGCLYFWSDNVLSVYFRSADGTLATDQQTFKSNVELITTFAIVDTVTVAVVYDKAMFKHRCVRKCDWQAKWIPPN